MIFSAIALDEDEMRALEEYGRPGTRAHEAALVALRDLAGSLA